MGPFPIAGTARIPILGGAVGWDAEFRVWGFGLFLRRWQYTKRAHKGFGLRV